MANYSWPEESKTKDHRQAHQPPGRTRQSPAAGRSTRRTLIRKGLLFASPSHLPSRPCARQEHRHQRGGEDEGRHGRSSHVEAGYGNPVGRHGSRDRIRRNRAARPATPFAPSRSTTKCCRTSSRKTTSPKSAPAPKPAGEQITGDPEAGFKEAEVVSEGTYGIPVITHCCLEPHGTVITWEGDKVEYLALHTRRLHRRQ